MTVGNVALSQEKNIQTRLKFVFASIDVSLLRGYSMLLKNKLALFAMHIGVTSTFGLSVRLEYKGESWNTRVNPAAL